MVMEDKIRYKYSVDEISLLDDRISLSNGLKRLFEDWIELKESEVDGSLRCLTHDLLLLNSA